MQQQNIQISQTETNLQNITNSMEHLLNGTVSFDCDETMQSLAQISNARSLGAHVLLQGLTLTQLGADLSLQLRHVFASAMNFFKEKYNTLTTRDTQRSFYLMFDESGLIPEEKRTIELPRFLEEPEK